MHVLHLSDRLSVPVLPGNIRIFLLLRDRLRRHQAPVAVVDRNTPKAVIICLIQEIHPRLNVLVLIRKVTLLDHVIVDRIRDLAHTHQIIFQSLTCLFHHLLCRLNDLLSGQCGKSDIHHDSEDQHDGDRDYGKHEHERGLYPLWLNFFQLA